MSAYISGTEPGSIAARRGIKPGSTLLKINGHDITDVLDYRFYMVDNVLKVTYKTPEGKFAVLKVVKEDEYEDLGLLFDTYLMDKQRRCKNKCIFCFIDQLPDGMRESLYFKDDDSRLSFFYGNYITLTNLTEKDVDRIISMHISPVNISVHTMNPELRVKMMNNKDAGKSLEYLRRLAKAGITVNTQLVLCPGINDGAELEYSLAELAALSPGVESIACVPVGLTDHREGLFPLEMYTKETARQTIEIIDRAGDKFKKELGKRLCFAADEFYIKAELPLPSEDYYEGYPQLDNGVGLCTLFREEVSAAIEDSLESGELEALVRRNGEKSCTISIATGKAAYPLIRESASKAEQLYSDVYNRVFACNDRADGESGEVNRSFKLKIRVYEIENRFFGKNITVSGLITGRDLTEQLRDKEVGSTLLISSSMVRTTYPQDDSGDNVLLDDMTTDEVSEILGAKVTTVENDGYEFIKNVLEAGIWQDR